MSKNWQKKRAKSERPKQEIFLPPDEDNFEKHGITNLVIKFSDFEPKMTLDKKIHIRSPFFKRKMLDGVMQKFLEELNEHIEPIKEEIQNLDRLSYLFLGIGILATFFIGLVLYMLISTLAACSLLALYLLSLSLVYYRNFTFQQTLQQQLVLNMAILIYLANQSTFNQRGVEA